MADTYTSVVQFGSSFAAAGLGYEVTQSSRLRRQIHVVPGLSSAADRHDTARRLGELRELCRAHDRQSEVFSGLLDRALDNIFGANFDYVQETGDTALDAKVRDYIWRRMEAKNCDAAGQMDLQEMLRIALRAVWNDGDILFVRRKAGDWMPFEADQVVSPQEKAAAGKRIAAGVELSETNRHMGYWVRQRKTSGDCGRVTADGFARVDSRDADFFAYRKRFGQTRGVPFLAAALERYERTNNYLTWESLAAEAGSMLGFKITREKGDSEFGGGAPNPDSGTSDTFDKVQKMEPLSVVELGLGEDLEMFGSNRPGEQFESYLTTSLRLIGVAVGFPLELLLLDFSKTNYSSARAALSEGRRMFRTWQRVAGEKLALPWYRWQVTRGIAQGAIPANARAYLARCQWPAWEYIDPYKEAMGNKVAIETRIKSHSECIRERGQEPEEVFAEIERDLARLRGMGALAEERNAEPPQKPDEQPDPEEPGDEKEDKEE